MGPIALAIHGGAGTITKAFMSPEKEAAYSSALGIALDGAYKILNEGGSATDAVEAAVRNMEDSPLFNAGKGAVFTADGTHELDASIMTGKDLRAGAIAGVTGLRNPISLARLVMERSGHVMLSGKGAEEFARSQQCAFESEEYFHDEFRHAQWQQVRGTDKTQLDHSAPADGKFGTVGAVALDAQGDLAAATSTGGMTNKRFGRVGDTPLIGCGTYANNTTCAVSCTGSGEFFIRGVAAYEVSALMEFGGLDLQAACRKVVHERLPAIGGDGGLIAVDHHGAVCMDFNTEGMYRAEIRTDGSRHISIYGT